MKGSKDERKERGRHVMNVEHIIWADEWNGDKCACVHERDFSGRGVAHVSGKRRRRERQIQ